VLPAHSTEIGAEAATELSPEEKEKAAYNFATSRKMPGGPRSSEPVPDDVSTLLCAWTDYFGGLGVDETAEVLHVSSITVMREWKSAKAWLYRELTRNGRRPLDARR
jgi:hypothetical protein